ncbi:serine/threonine protein kinase [Calothrix brevissima NIES-22]|nr:serine/threonine protein kinase [Calothrix brevissima NIES-22]
MICCLNSSCLNPAHADGTEFCSHCGVPLIVLRHYRPIRVLLEFRLNGRDEREKGDV